MPESGELILNILLCSPRYAIYFDILKNEDLFLTVDIILYFLCVSFGGVD